MLLHQLYKYSEGDFTLMNILASIATTDPIVYPLFIVGTTLLILGMIFACVGIFLDLKILHREQAQGKQGVCYRRPNIILNTGLLLVCLAGILSLSIASKVILYSRLLYIPLFILCLAGLVLLLYSFILRRQKPS